jgi:intracellular multiplication protein IcmD
MVSRKFAKAVISMAVGMLSFYMASALAANDIGDIANTVTGTFESVGKLMIAVAYLAGFGFTIAAIFKFKQHKDNPQQASICTAITMLLVGVALIFLPNIFAPAGSTIFGSGATAGGFTGEGVSAIPGAQ